ncbi:MAG: thiol-disulfide oxidoreductase DCC family protein [Bacteroidota bacterium]|nr:thiol-disulfide oxidoreductase DCC family protein [Bacteroidota bacterium]
MIEWNEIKSPVILFDGVCNLCCGSVQFIIKRDKKKQFRFASLQSKFGKNVLYQFELNENNMNSFILIEDGKLFTRSTAALKVAKQLSGAWKMMYVFILVPAFIRNYMYSVIANKRYKWFGKKEECWLPTENMKNLFLG